MPKSKIDLNCGHLGNGITVWNSAIEKNGDYQKIAHINPHRSVTWYIKKPTKEMITYVTNIVNGPNPSISTSQPDQKIFIQ